MARRKKDRTTEKKRKKVNVHFLGRAPMTINLAPFCKPVSKATCYPGIRKPFQIDEWTYATDGPILVRIPAITKNTPTNKVPKVNEEFQEFNVAACKELWPECEGEITKNDGYRIPLQTVSCRKIAGVYWLRIAVLGNVLFNPRGEQNDVIEFVSGDLQGLIMPMKQDK